MIYDLNLQSHGRNISESAVQSFALYILPISLRIENNQKEKVIFFFYAYKKQSLILETLFCFIIVSEKFTEDIYGGNHILL